MDNVMMYETQNVPKKYKSYFLTQIMNHIQNFFKVYPVKG